MDYRTPKTARVSKIQELSFDVNEYICVCSHRDISIFYSKSGILLSAVLQPAFLIHFTIFHNCLFIMWNRLTWYFKWLYHNLNISSTIIGLLDYFHFSTNNAFVIINGLMANQCTHLKLFLQNLSPGVKFLSQRERLCFQYYPGKQYILSSHQDLRWSSSVLTIIASWISSTPSCDFERRYSVLDQGLVNSWWAK